MDSSESSGEEDNGVNNSMVGKSNGNFSNSDSDVGTGRHGNFKDDRDDNPNITTVSKKAEGSKSKKKKKKKSLEKLGLPGGLKLTPKLINQLTETEKLYQSNMYKFQIQELLQEITVAPKVCSKMEKWLAEFNGFLKTLEPSEPYAIDNSNIWLGDVKLPLPEHIIPKKGSKGIFKWIRPELVYEIGSWASNCAVYRISTLDIALQMPGECLNNSDYLNHKYHVKRAMYLTYLAIQLRSRGDELTFICSDGNPLRPMLQILVSKKKSLKVRIHCIPPPELFKTKKLSPEKNNLRFEYFFKMPKHEDDPEYSTANYNTTILNDILMQQINTYSKHMLTRNENFCQAIKLLKVWLQQRNLNQGFGSFSNFIMRMFVCYLGERKKINNNMSNYQIIRIVFVNLLQTDWTSTGISFSVESNIKDWHLQYDVVFLDSSNQLNFAANLSKFTYNRVKIEAKLGLDILNTSKVTGFQSMFMTKVPFFLNFDHILQVKMDTSLTSRLLNNPMYKSLFLNYSSYIYPIGVSIIGQLIERCLKQRLQVIDVELPLLQEWNLTSSVNNIQVQVIRFGIVTQQELASKLIEKCESENELATQEFKDLWKEKSLLRRFRDGSMVETVTFENVNDTDKSRVCFLMLKYILETHLGILMKDESEDYLDNQLERISEPQFEIVKLETGIIVKNDKEVKQKKTKRTKQKKEEVCHISLDEITNFASKSFDDLTKILRQLDTEGLPLAVTSVQGTSSILRSSNVYPTPPQLFYPSQLLTEEKESSLIIKNTGKGLPKLPKYIEPIGVVVQLEGSGKWPDNINAIERLKCGFLIRIGQLLNEQFGLCVQAHPRYLDVLKDGFVFRIKLTYYRELILLKQLRSEDGILRIRDNSKSQSLERNTLLLPQLTSTLHAFSQQFSAFGKTCRLSKRWIASQLLLVGISNSSDCSSETDCRFTEESVELIVAYLFLQFEPYLSSPNEGQAGFLRFLYFIGNTNWKSTSIIVNFNGKLTKEDIDNIESEFVKKRDSLPLLFISTPEDKLGSVWTKHLHPIILNRVSLLARQALNLLTHELTNFDIGKTHRVDLKTIFMPDITNFDVLIWLKKDMNTRKGQGIELKSKLQFKEYCKKSNELMPIVDFDPTQLYLEELRNCFGHLSVFFHDQFGGQFIAVVWKPQVLDPTEFKVSNVKARVSGNIPKTIVVNVENIIKLFQVMGRGLVDRVEISSHQKLEV